MGKKTVNRPRGKNAKSRQGVHLKILEKKKGVL